MQELDLLLLRYLEAHYPDAPAVDKAAFQAFLELPDPELLGYLLHGERPESAAYDRIIRTVHGETSR
jgi:succinate dehydrogenase flavin-adding protein (antitoxin of CptAB toxin-antitoxin module)